MRVVYRLFLVLVLIFVNILVVSASDSSASPRASKSGNSSITKSSLDKAKAQNAKLSSKVDKSKPQGSKVSASKVQDLKSKSAKTQGSKDKVKIDNSKDSRLKGQGSKTSVSNGKGSRASDPKAKSHEDKSKAQSAKAKSQADNTKIQCDDLNSQIERPEIQPQDKISNQTYSKQDRDYVNCFSLLRQKKWQEALDIASKKKDRALQKIILSQKYLDSSCDGNLFTEITKFISDNPGWPRERDLKVIAENNIDKTTSSKLLYEWFSKHPPVSAKGNKYYALAMDKVSHDNPEKFSKIIKNGWRLGSFCSDQEAKEYYDKFKKYLNSDDVVAKIDLLLMNKQTTMAKSLMCLLQEGYRNSFKAQIELIDRPSQAEEAIKRIPLKYQTAGLVYRYLASIKTNPPRANEIVSFINNIKDPGSYGDKLYDVQNYIVREYIEKKLYSDAYKVISTYFTSNPSKSSNAEFLSGWLALRFLKNPKLAVKHFEKFNNIVSTPVSKSRGLYWLARSYLLEKNNKENAKEIFQQVASDYPYTFYGQVAAIEVGKGAWKLPDRINLKAYKDDDFINKHDLFKAATIVARYGGTGMNQEYLKAAVAKAKDKKEILHLAAALNDIQNHHYKVWFAKQAIAKNVFIRDMNYPTPYSLKNFSPTLQTEAALIYSIIRQESVFDHSAISYADAYGLMQLIEPTACSVSKSINIGCSVSKLTSDPKYNIILGSTYLSDLIKEYDGSYILTAAAYNAGPKISKWLVKFGDLRKMSHHYDVIDWMELIPFEQTRDYVQRVLENLQIYRAIIQQNNHLHIKDELMHTRVSSS